MSRSVAQLQLGSLLTFVVQVATKAHTEARGLGWSLWFGWSLGAMPLQGPYRHTDMDDLCCLLAQQCLLGLGCCWESWLGSWPYNSS